MLELSNQSHKKEIIVDDYNFSVKMQLYLSIMILKLIFLFHILIFYLIWYF